MYWQALGGNLGRKAEGSQRGTANGVGQVPWQMDKSQGEGIESGRRKRDRDRDRRREGGTDGGRV